MPFSASGKLISGQTSLYEYSLQRRDAEATNHRRGKQSKYKTIKN